MTLVSRQPSPHVFARAPAPRGPVAPRVFTFQEIASDPELVRYLKNLPGNAGPVVRNLGQDPRGIAAFHALASKLPPLTVAQIAEASVDHDPALAGLLQRGTGDGLVRRVPPELDIRFAAAVDRLVRRDTTGAREHPFGTVAETATAKPRKKIGPSFTAAGGVAMMFGMATVNPVVCTVGAVLTTTGLIINAIEA